MDMSLAELTGLDGPNLFPNREPLNPSQLGVAAPCNSEQFKSDKNKHKPPAKQWHNYLSTESASRMKSSLKDVVKHLQDPNVISLGGGIPSGDYIPFNEITLTPTPLTSLDLRKEKVLSTLKTTLYSTKRDVIEQKSIYDLSIALNYGQGCGSPQLLRWITEHTEMVHNPPYADWQCSMTIGNTSALDMCLRMLTHKGDYVLTDKYTFSTAIEMAKPMGINFIGIEMDGEGMLPTSLNKTLTNWDSEINNNTRKPFLLYLIPTGQNPTGTTQSLQRRQDIYKVAQKHDLLILEDDPYYFLQMDEYGHLNMNRLTSNIRSLGDLFKKILPSYLSMDIDGRVIRMDSFSKVISPGARLGWITACKQVIERYQYHTDVSTQSPSGVSQLAFFKLLDEYWGHAGYVRWLIQLRKSYTERRDIFITACEKHLPKNVISWVPTHAGMFQWFLIDWRKHPNALQKSLSDLEEEIWLESISAGTLLGKGSWFSTLISKGDTEIFYRATFAAAPLDKIEEAVKQFGEALRKTFKIKIEMEP